MSKPCRLARPLPTNTASKVPPSRKEELNSKKLRKISLGEKILRAGSEGNLGRQQQEQVPTTEVLVQRKIPLLKGNNLFHLEKERNLCSHRLLKET